MSVLYNEEQEAIGNEANRVLSAQFDSPALKGLLESRGQFDEKFWATCQEQGWTGISIPEEFGGLGLGLIEQGIIAMACGRNAVGAPFLTSSYGAAQAIVLYGDDDAKAAWLEKLAAGEVIGTLAFAEKQSPVPAHPAVTFRNGRLNGTKEGVCASGAANLAIVLASGDQGPALVAVALDSDGVSRELLTTFDNSRLTGSLGFDSAEGTLLVEGAAALDAALHLLARQAVVTAHEQVGGAEAMMTKARDYSLERRAFGQPIGKFQSVKHRIAEMYVLVELARANAIHAAASEGQDDFLAAAAAARLTATEAYDTSARDGVQVHGGIGVTWEADLHLHVRRARTLANEQGNLFFWEDRLVDELAKDAA